MNQPQVPSKAWPVAIALALNAIPIIGVLFWGWSAFALVFLYWFENVVIGVRTLASMLANAAVSGGAIRWVAALAMGAFFTVHYGIFCFVHGMFVVGLFGKPEAGPSENMIDVTLNLWPALAPGFASIIAWQVVKFVLFFTSGQARRTNPLELMGAPYPRIIVLHVAIIGGAFLLMAFNQPLAGILALALLKTAFDVADAMGKGPRFSFPDPEAANAPSPSRAPDR